MQKPQRHVAWVVGPQHLLFTLQACSYHDKPLVPKGLATDVWWHWSQWYVRKTVPDLNQLWNCWFFNSLTSLLLLNCNTGPIGYLLAVYHNLSLQFLYCITPFFTFFKGKLSSISVSSHMGNFTCPFPFLPPLSELCLALVQVSSETWEYWVTSAAICCSKWECIINFINCLYLTHYSLSCSLHSLTSCLTKKLELCSASKWSLGRPQWHSAVFPKPLQVIESPVRHTNTSIFFFPSACHTLSEQSWTLPDTVSPIHLAGLGASEVSHSLFRILLILHSLQIWRVHSHIFPECPEQPRRQYGTLSNLKGKFLPWWNTDIETHFLFCTSELIKTSLWANVIWNFLS